MSITSREGSLTGEENELRKLADAAELPIYITSFSGDFSEARAREFRYDFLGKS